MASKVTLCNMAIAALGAGDLIVALTERSAEARACSLFYEETLKEVLRDFSWPFATKVATLSLVEENPSDEWAYAYRYPVDCVKARRILSGLRNDTRATRVPTRLYADDAGNLIYADQPDAQLEYTMLSSDPSRYPADFNAAFSFLLAVRIAPLVTGGDAFDIMPKVQKLYELQILKAKANAANEEQPDVEPESEVTRAYEG